MNGSLAGLAENLAEVSHPLGSMAFQSRRNHVHQRPILAYGEYDDVLGSATHDDAAEPQDAGMLEGGGGGAGSTEPRCDSADAMSAGDGVQMQDGSGAVVPSRKPGGRRPPIRSVNLPRWMDLDQETLPNVPPPVLLGRHAPPDARAEVKAEAPAAGGRVLPMDRPRSLGAFGGVGELTVQMHTDAVPYRFSAASAGDGYEALLADYAQRAAKRQAAAVHAGQVDPTAASAQQGAAAAQSAAAVRSAGGGAAGAARGKGGGRDGKAGTPPDGYICALCKVAGHWKQDCPAPPPSYTCHNCDGKGHFIANCPKPKRKAAAGAKRARDGATGAGELDTDGAAAAASSEVKKRPKVKDANVPPEGYVCHMCSTPGHWIKDCPLKARERAADRPPPPKGYVCVKCQQAGHWVEMCLLRGHQGQPRPAAVELVIPSTESVEIGTEIAEALEEEGGEPVMQVCRVVEVMGERASRQLLVQAWQVEENGGLLRTDGSEKRRTPGGVFLWLVKQQASAQQRAMIWPLKQTAEERGGAAAA
jgi:hypothetical protein